MFGTFNNPDNNIINYQYNNSMQYTRNTFKALVDAIIPRTPELAEEYGRIQYFGALDLHTYEFIILTLNNYYTPLANSTAELLDEAAEQVVFMEEPERLFNFSRLSGGGTFAALSPSNQFRALTLLEQGYLEDLPIVFYDNQGFVLSANIILNRNTMLGYYSEWFGYGTTRLETPNQRILEFYPLSWQQIGYPGPSLGYRALRV